MIGTMEDPVGLISSKLRDRGIALPKNNAWLNGCIECFMSSNPDVTPNQLFDLVFEQWTLADLADVGAPSLPPSCAKCNKMMLTGKYAVQINYFLNVAVPFHKQLQKIRRPSAQNNLEVDSERQERERDRHKESTEVRALKMEITDGTTTVIAFEDQPITAIKNPIPGEKAVLTGPIEVRKGVIMLKPENITILGGEVDTLLVKNAPENLMARALNQEENVDPYNLQNPALREAAPVLQVPPRAPTVLPTVRHTAAVVPTARRTASVLPSSAAQSTTPPNASALLRTPPAPASNSFHEALDDGEDEALASLADALENDSFHLESPDNYQSTGNLRPNTPPSTSNPLPVPSRTNTNARNYQSKQSSSTQKPTKQSSISAFLLQPKKTSCSQVFDSSSEVDDGFDDDFEMIAAQTASLAEKQASKNTLQDNHDPNELKKQLEATYARGRAPCSTPSSNIRPEAAKVGLVGSFEPNTSSANRTNIAGKPPETKMPNKRKDVALERDIFGRPKIPRNESTISSNSLEAQPFKNPRHALPQDDLMDSEELYDWLPPPPKANLEHVRPSHEKGKILIDYTDPSTLDPDLVSTQKPLCTPRKTEPQPTLLEEPFPPKEFPCTRKTLGKVVKVVNKLQLRDAKWILSAVVQAKGIELEMDFSPEALDKIFTVTAEEITRQKEQLKKNPELKEKFNAQLRESQKRIQTLECEMSIHFKNFISKPVVLDVYMNG